MEQNNNNLTSEEILNNILAKELNSKKNILDAIEKTKPLLKEELSKEKAQEIYTIIYNSIEKMNTVVKANTIILVLV